MNASVRLLALAGVLVISAVGAAEWSQRTQRANAGPTLSRTNPSERRLKEARETRVQVAADYSSIVHRNLFRPLVVAPKRVEAPVAASASPRDAQQRSAPRNEPPKPPLTPSVPADPLADLALTGVVEVGGRLQVLIEKMSEGTGKYVALQDEFEGFRVVLIGENSAVLERDGRQYTLTMGSKQLSEARPASRTASPSSAKPIPPLSSAHVTGSAVPAGRMPSAGALGLTGDLLSWAESQSLAELERMYGRYGQYLSPADRARAEAYLSERRARER